MTSKFLETKKKLSANKTILEIANDSKSVDEMHVVLGLLRSASATVLK